MSTTSGITVGRKALHQLHAVLERETGAQAPLLLREIGFATGESLYGAFVNWCRERYHVEKPQELDVAHLGGALSGYFSDAGWGQIDTVELGSNVLALDMPAWAEAEPRGATYPSCHFSSGMLADFFTRLGGAQAAVMEVECLCRGDARCRFLLGSPDLLTHIYERMAAGMSYQEAMAK
jgi:predicted hydrocarbon binding protein